MFVINHSLGKCASWKDTPSFFILNIVIQRVLTKLPRWIAVTSLVTDTFPVYLLFFFPSYAFQRASFTRLIFLAPRSTLSDLISKRDRDALLVIYRSNRPRVKSWRRDEKRERAKYEMLMRARRPSNIKRVFTWAVLQKKSSIWTHSARNPTYPQDNYRLFSFQESTQRRKKRPRVRRVVNRSRDDVYLRWIHSLSLCTALTI